MFEACFKFRKMKRCLFIWLFVVLLFAQFTLISIVSSESGETPEEINKILMSGGVWIEYPVLTVLVEPPDPLLGRGYVPHEVKWIAETRQLWLNITVDFKGERVTAVFIDLPAFDALPEEIIQIINGTPANVPYRVYKCDEPVAKKLIIDVLPTIDSYPNSYLESYEYFVANGWDKYYALRGRDRARGLDDYYVPVDPQARERDASNISAAFVWEENYTAHGWDKPGAYVWYRSYYLYVWNPVTVGEWKNPLENLPPNACRCAQCMDAYIPECYYTKPFWVISMNITYSSPATILISRYPIAELPLVGSDGSEPSPEDSRSSESPPDDSNDLDLTPFLVAVPVSAIILCVAIYVKRIRKRKLST